MGIVVVGLIASGWLVPGGGDVRDVYRPAGDALWNGHVVYVYDFPKYAPFLYAPPWAVVLAGRRADRLAETAIEGAEGDSALDLYAGVGLFTLPLARRFRQVTAVESGSGASRDLRFNLDRAGLAQVRSDASTVEAFLEKLKRAPDFVLVDPPRSGLGKAVVERLKELRPRLLTIVACDPATLARDLASLVAGGYKMRKVTLVDLFPQTYHLETVVSLSLG